jgi:hypothetical protein
MLAVAADHGPDTVHVETDALTDYSRAVYGQAGDFAGGWLGGASWAAPATSRENRMTGRFENHGQALDAVGSPLPDGAKFWDTHGRRTTEMGDFNRKLGLSLEAISAASGAIVQAYESTDQVNADNISGSAAYFRPATDAAAGTLEGGRRAAQAQPPLPG